jgi:hypothetical protein
MVSNESNLLFWLGDVNAEGREKIIFAEARIRLMSQMNIILNKMS